MNNEYTNGYLTEASVRHLCLCSGYDGVGRGLKRVFPNLRTVAYVEREGFPIANLVTSAEENQMDAAPIFTDVKAFPYDKFRGCVDILSAGFPCQPFSSAGKRQSTDDERHLYPWIADGITACRPGLVLLENVDGIVTAKTADGESVLRYVLRDLEERGYTCSWCVASASEVGAPHQRKRVFILAKLANTPRTGAYRKARSSSKKVEGSREPLPRQFERTNSRPKELGYASSVGSCGGSADESRQRSEVLGSRSESDAFPARPNERQHEWEEPRTVVAELGGATDGRPCRVNPVANRVDRLRLLGNGVVPATCERAVRILWNESWIS